jgi:nucleotide-binding universal stress UspA family protein
MFETVLVAADRADRRRDALELATDLGGPHARYAAVDAPPGSDRACAFSPPAGNGPERPVAGEHADLVVVSAGQRRHLSRLFRGDEGLCAARPQSCAVAVVPAGYRTNPGGWHAVGVGDDGSTHAGVALRAASELARAHRAGLRAVSVLGPENLFRRESTSPDLWPDLDRLTQRRRARLDALPGAEGEVVCGSIVERLVELSAEVDLLVVATRRQGPISRLLSGTVGVRLAAAARCPLLVLAQGFGGADARPDAGSRRPRTRATVVLDC